MKRVKKTMKANRLFGSACSLSLFALSALTTTVATSVANAQMDMEFRRNNAVALYEFNGDSGRIVRDTSRIGAPLNLRILNPLAAEIQQMPNHLWVDTKGGIQSDLPATKIINACKTSQELSIEVWMENNEGQLLRTGNFPNQTFQPSRVVSLAENITKNNFQIGQFYDNGDFLAVAANTSGIEVPARPGATLSNLLRSETREVIIPNLERDYPPKETVQKMIFTLTKDAVARVYLSDRDGNLARRQLTSTGFRSGNGDIFSTWYPNAKLSLGNVATDWATILADKGDYRSCAGNGTLDPECATNSRYWKGKLFLVAVYCKALTDFEILGTKSQQASTNQVFPIDPNLIISPELKRAQEIYRRVTGSNTPIYNPALKDMETFIKQSDGVSAAEIATRDPSFINVTVRDMAAQISTRAQTKNVPLNDFIVSFAGAVKDDMDFRKILYDNFIYEANPDIVAVPSSEVNDKLRSPAHYEALDNMRVDLTKVLIKKKQRLFNGRIAVDAPEEATAGLITSRTYLASHMIAGTGRRGVEKMFEHFLCLPLEKVADTAPSDDVVGKDIDRQPGGSYTKYTTTCKACHTILDAMRPAFANFTFNSDYVMHSYLVPTGVNANQEAAGAGFRNSGIAGAGFIHAKFNQNDMDTSNPAAPFVKPGTYVMSTNWKNNATFGSNAKKLGWGEGSMNGSGIKSLGKAFSETKQFPICMATRVFESVCGREPAASEDVFIKASAEDFKSRKYNMKYLFQRIVSSNECIGKMIVPTGGQ